MNDPIDEMVKAALDNCGVPYRRDDPLDFECEGFAIEVTQFYTPRKIKQLEGRDDVIFVQGRSAAKAFVKLLQKERPNEDDLFYRGRQQGTGLY